MPKLGVLLRCSYAPAGGAEINPIRPNAPASAHRFSIHPSGSRSWISFHASPTPRVKATMNSPQDCLVDRRVDLRRRERSMSEKLLHNAQGRSLLKHVRREGVTQEVRMKARMYPARRRRLVS